MRPDQKIYFRETDRFTNKFTTNFEFPKDMKFTNYIAGFVATEQQGKGFNVVMSDGTLSRLALECEGPYELVKVQPLGAPISLIVLNGDSTDSELYGIKLFASNGQQVLQVGDTEVGLERKEIKV